MTGRIRKIVFTIICVACLATFAFADAVIVDPAKTLIEKPVTLKLIINLQPGEKAVLPEKLHLPDDAELLHIQSGEPQKEEGGGITQTVTYEIVLHKVGHVTIPELEYKVIDANGDEEERTAGPAKVDVQSVLTNAEGEPQPKDIRSPVEVPLHWKRFIIPVAALIGAMIAGILLYRWFSRRERPEVAPPPLPVKLPHEIALEEIETLRADDPFGQGSAREHFFRLSEIVRKYIEGRYGVLALERTTHEIESEFDERFVMMEIKAPLMNLLKACDLVKFAKQKPGREQADTAVNRAVEFIEATKPKSGAGRDAV